MTGIEVVSHPYDADIFLFNKYTYHNLELLKKRGVKILVDIDDYWKLSVGHYYYENWKAHEVTERCRMSMYLSDAVITTNARLAEKIRPLNANVHVVPNALPYGFGQFDMKQADWTGTVRFVGGKSHDKDIRLIPGYAIPARLPVSSYMQHYEGVNITLAPLIDNEFNSFKSNLKILEAGAAYAACIASDVPAFASAPVMSVRPGEWQEAIKEALQCPEETQADGRRLNEWCRTNYDLRNVNVLRKLVLESL